MKTLPRIVPLLALLTLTAAAHANNIDSVTDYDPGLNDPLTHGDYQLTGNPAIGLPATTDGFGTDVTPFTPAFAATDLTEINSGGHITLHFASPITTAAGPQVGVFSNVGITANFDPDSGAITASSSNFSPLYQAVVSVSATGLAGSFVTLNAGNPISFTNPTSAFSDTDVSFDEPDGGFVLASGGATPNSFFKPFTGNSDQFVGETYAQMNATLNGSAGGTWLDISSAGLPQVNFIRFDVPDGDELVLDAITAVPEPSSLGLLIVGLIALARRKQR